MGDHLAFACCGVIVTKVKAEVASQLEAVAISCSRVDDIDLENKSLLARAKRVEGEVTISQLSTDVLTRAL